ncbi:hypothetical protein NC239_33795 [Streptomyces sp. G3]|uniref:hypothetical protein n=1 Tax=Streptomyces sp. G3 TaxID=690144 RepID=UPI0020302610|nr:hypothetical protein [Streptomyces sp. G3]MCM1943188.1 hypothetical protein [Streptomyces sp. G3]
MKLTYRAVVSHFGRHRAHRATAHTGFPPAVFGAVATQAFRHCRPCGGDVPVVLHPGAHTCTEGHVTITQGGQ